MGAVMIPSPPGEVRVSTNPQDVVALRWRGGLSFEARAGGHTLVVDGSRESGVSPTQALAVSLAGCMAIDVVDILQKGRLALNGLDVHLVSERRAEPPRHVTGVALRFVVHGPVPPDRMERAIELSRERYCSVWHSLRPDIAFQTSFEVAPTPAPGRAGAPPPPGDAPRGGTGR
jgi:putative redox protein